VLETRAQPGRKLANATPTERAKWDLYTPKKLHGHGLTKGANTQSPTNCEKATRQWGAQEKSPAQPPDAKFRSADREGKEKTMAAKENDPEGGEQNREPTNWEGAIGRKVLSPPNILDDEYRQPVWKN